jgi:hypothetical protein
LLAVLALSSAAQAEGDEPSAAQTAAARSLAIDGMKLAQSGKCEEAVDKLERAEKLYHSSIVGAQLGECYVKVGRLVEGTEALRRILREPLPDNPSPALQQAREKAQKTLDWAKPRIAQLTIAVEGPEAGTELQATLDGKPIPAEVLGSAFPVDPGDHVIEVKARGYLPRTVNASLGVADSRSLSLKLERDPNAETAAPAAAAEATGAAPRADEASSSDADSSPQSPPKKPNRTPAIVAWGVGAVGLGVGAVFGALAASEHSDLESDCPDNVCPSSKKDALDSAKMKGTVATVGFGVGAAGLALGTVLYFTAGKAPRESAGCSGVFCRPRAVLSPTGVQFRADF